MSTYPDHDHTTDDGWAVGSAIMVFVFFSFFIWSCMAVSGQWYDSGYYNPYNRRVPCEPRNVADDQVRQALDPTLQKEIDKLKGRGWSKQEVLAAVELRL